MRRNSKHSIRFGDENELAITHGMSLQGGLVVCDWYDIEGENRRIRYLPEELALLRAAIDEMLRMAEQHRDALTDGAGNRVAEADEAESGSKHELGMGLLRWLASDSGHRVASFHEAFQWLFNADLLIHTAGDNYTISDAGRALLEAQEPSVDALTVGEADLVSADDVKLLRMLSEGITLELGHSALGRFSKRGWVAFKDAHILQPSANWKYGIIDKGRRALAAQAPS